ncbi:MAG: arginine--tRNA ligase [Candidatus Thorarchaeota archaeon]
MENPWNYCENLAVNMISEVAKIDTETVRQFIEIPPDPQLGDVATTISFQLAKQLKKNPTIIANELVQQLKEQMQKYPLIRTVEAKGPYINIFFEPSEMAKIVLDTVRERKESYGRSSENAGRRAMIEFPAVNPSKPWHIGHARNAILGDTLSNVLEATGYEVIRIDYINDLGLQIAQLIWKLMQDTEKPKKGEKYDHFLGRLYVEVQKAFEDKNVEKQVREIGQQLEDPNSDAFKLGTKMVTECVKSQNKTAYDLGIYHHYQIWESSIAHSGLLERARKMMLQCDSIFKMKEGEKAGCIVAKLDDLEEFKGMKDPYKVLFRSDGTRTYTGADVAFQMWKHRIVEDPFHYTEFETQPNGEIVYRSSLKGKKHDLGKINDVFNVIAAAQAHPQRLIYSILDLLGYKKASKNSHHVAYEFVGLEETGFSGRKGTWIGYTTDDVLDRARELATEEVKKRNPDADDEFVESVATQVAVGALRYFMLNASPDRKITFRWSEALDFDGDAGPYLQYSHARAQRILEKAGDDNGSPDLAVLTAPQEYALIKAISRFPNEVLEVVRGLSRQPRGSTFSSNRLTTYGFELGTLFSKFYDNCPVLKADGDIRAARLELVRAFKQTMANCLRLLGIPVVNRM